MPSPRLLYYWLLTPVFCLEASRLPRVLPRYTWRFRGCLPPVAQSANACTLSRNGRAARPDKVRSYQGRMGTDLLALPGRRSTSYSPSLGACVFAARERRAASRRLGFVVNPLAFFDYAEHLIQRLDDEVAVVLGDAERRLDANRVPGHAATANQHAAILA